MAKILVGDFRSASMRAFAVKSDYAYIIENTAGVRWFNDIAITQLNKVAAENDSIIIMLGFNDCVNCCEYDYLKPEDAASTLTAAINRLVAKNTNTNFYVCSVNPISADYASDRGIDGVIEKHTLDSMITKFNSTLKNQSKAVYLDTYTYLTETSFSTIDGVHFTEETCLGLFAYLNAQVNSIDGLAFEARIKAPKVATGNIDMNPYWLSEEHGGLNPFYGLGQPNLKCVGDTLPNSTSYAWGRFYEILGDTPTLSTGKLETWYTDTADGYQRGQEPKLGAIMCWKGTTSANTDGKDGRGHLAIVEKINADGSIKTSESAFGDQRYWWTTTRLKGIDGNWGQDSSVYTFQGFIYCPNVSTGGAVGDYISKSQLVTKNKYLKKVEQEINARYIWSYFGSKGWSINAVAALLGNMQSESTLSPNRCEGSSKVAGISSEHPTAADVESYAYRYYNAHGRFPGYGLVQWTGQRYGGAKNNWSDQKFIYWCKQNRLDPSDMDTQLERIHLESTINGGWALASYNRGYTFRGESFDKITFKEFITSTKDPGWLAAAFAFCYEKPASSVPSKGKRDDLCAIRASQAEAWYSFLSGLPSIATTVVSEGLYLDNFKLDSCDSTSAYMSFIAKKADTITYTLKQNNKTKTTKEVDISGIFTSFNLNNLIPNTEYDIILTANSGNDSKSKNVSFTTAQDLPKSISSISIMPVDEKLPYNNFKLSVYPNNINFGYWASNGYGYTVQLIVNGQVIKEKDVKTLPNTVNIASYFGYKPKITDIIQIGIRTWSKYNSSKLFDSDYAIASNAVCLLKNEIIAYIN